MMKTEIHIHDRRGKLKDNDETKRLLKEKYNLDRDHLSNVNKTLIDFRHLTLEGVDFSGSDLRGADFSDSLLTGAKFDNANLQGAIFDYAGLLMASFKGVIANGTSFVHCLLRQTRFDNASLDSLPYEINGTQYLRRTNFNMAWFDASILDGAKLRGVSMQYADLRNSSFHGAIIDKAHAKSVDMYIMPTFQYSDMSFVDMRSLDLRNAPLLMSRLDHANLSNTNLSGCLFWHSSGLWRANLYQANLSKARFLSQEYNLQDANLEKANLQDTDLRRAVFSSLTRFKGATYNDKTRFPEGFSPKEKGLIKK